MDHEWIWRCISPCISHIFYGGIFQLGAMWIFGGCTTWTVPGTPGDDTESMDLDPLGEPNSQKSDVTWCDVCQRRTLEMCMKIKWWNERFFSMPQNVCSFKKFSPPWCSCSQIAKKMFESLANETIILIPRTSEIPTKFTYAFMKQLWRGRKLCIWKASNISSSE